MTQLTQIDLGSHPIFDRPGLALNALLSGDFEAAGRALYDPDSLSPRERQTLADKMGVVGTPWEGILDITTNPLVLIGIAMSLRWPIPTAEKLVAFRGGASQLAKRWGWARFVSPVAENYRNTKVPDILQAIHTERVTELKTVHEQWAKALGHFKTATGRVYPNVTEETIVAGLMDDISNPRHQVWGQARAWLERSVAKGGAGRPDLAETLRNVRLPVLDAAPTHLWVLAEDTKGILQGVWRRVFADPDNQQRMRGILGRKQGFESNLKSEELRQLFRYWPHMRSISRVEESELAKDYWRSHLKTSIRERLRAGLETRQSPFAAADRYGKMMPEPNDLKALGASDDVLRAINYVDEDAVRLAQAGERSAGFKGVATTAVTRQGAPVYYHLHYSKGLSKYFDEVARAKALTIPPVRVPGKPAHSLGERLRHEINVISDQGQSGLMMARKLEDTIVPQVLGGMSNKQAAMSTRWSATKERAVQSLDWFRDRKILPERIHQKMTQWLIDDPSSSLPGIGASISSFMYVSTLGIPNPVPASLNLLQPITTTLPLGAEHMVVGYRKAIGKMFKYASLRASGTGKEQAIQKAMPEFAAAHLELDPTSSEAVREVLESSVQRAFGTGRVRKVTEEIKAKMLSVFSHSEMFNRLVTFETALVKGTRELPGQRWYDVLTDVTKTLPRNANHPDVKQAARKFATDITYMTQFGGGPLQRPMGTLDWWSPLAQFTTFPTRMLGLGIGPMTRHPGYGGRALMTAGLAYGVAKHGLEADISRGLFFGGLPEPSGRGPFPTLPIVPPTLQIGGAAVMSAVTGETEHIRRALPLFVPGGVGMARAAGYIPGGQPVAEALVKYYADYDHRTPDGRVPVYTSKGMLVGYYSDAQILARAAGLGNVSGQQEVALSKYLLGQRDRIRGMKREYIQALYESDGREALRLQDTFEKRYPGMGGIPIKPSDIRALHLREDVTRLERMLETMPPELRPMFTNVVNVTFGAQAPMLMGLAQQMRAHQTIRMREPYRRHPQGQTRRRVSKGLHGMKLREKLGLRGRDRLGRDPGKQSIYGGQTWYPVGTNY